MPKKTLNEIFNTQESSKPTLGSIFGDTISSQSEEKPGYLQRVGQDIKQGFQQAKQDISSTDSRSALSKGVSAVSNVASAVASPLTEAPGIKQIGEITNKGIELAGNELSKVYSPEFVKKLGEMSPEEFDKFTETLKLDANLGNIANTILIAKGGVKTGELAKNGASKVIDGADGVIKPITNTINNVIENPTKYPKQLVDIVSEKITPIDPKIKNILETTSLEKFNNYVKYGEEAIKDPRALTPLERAGDMVTKRVLPAIKEDLSNIGKQLEQSLSPIAKNQIVNATQDAVSTLIEGIKKYKLTPAEAKLVQQAKSYLEIGKSPTVESISKTVDLLQNTLYEAKGNLALKVTPRVQAVVNQTIGKLNETLKKYVKENLQSSEYTKLNAEYSLRKSIFDKLNKSLGSDGMRGGSLVKRFFSPQDSGIKKIFSDIKKLYGIDLAEDATLAKFVMDSLGDVRAKSLLEQVPLSKSGIITKGLEYVENKLTRPIEKARKIIKKRPQVKL